MGLADGDVIAPEDLHKIHDKNFKRLLTWMSVGEDVVNGLWAVYGARLGCHMTNVTREDWDWKNVRDFRWLTNFFETELFPQFEGGDELCVNTGARWDKAKLKEKTVELGYDLRKKLKLKIADMGVEGSAFFKEVYINPSRLGAQVKEEQVEDTLE